MTKQKDRGGYVHPQPPYIDPKGGVYPSKSKGITLRDEFAKAAMQGIFNSAIDWFPTGQKPDQESLKLFKDIAQDSYAMADAMLEARSA